MPRCLAFIVLWLVSGAALGLQAVPRNLKEEYQPIITRNPFDLKPVEIAKPVEPPAKPAEPPKKQEVYLTGIASVGYPTFPKKAYLVIREAGTNQYYSLSENEKRDTLKLIKINDEVKPPTVRVEHNGSEVLLSFKTHALPSNAGAVPGRPVMPNNPGGPPGIPQPLPGGSPAPVTSNFTPNAPLSTPPGYNGPTINGRVPGTTHIPSRVNRTVPENNFTGSPGQFNNPAINNGGVPGTAPLGAGPGGNNYGDPAGNNVDLAEQYLRLRLEETRSRQQGIPHPPIPVLE